MNYLLHKQTCMCMYWLDSTSTEIKKLLFNKVHTFILYTTYTLFYIHKTEFYSKHRERVSISELFGRVSNSDFLGHPRAYYGGKLICNDECCCFLLVTK